MDGKVPGSRKKMNNERFFFLSEERRKRRTFNGGWADCIVCRVDSFRRIIGERDSRERGGGNRSSAHARGKRRELGKKKIRERVDDESDAVASAGVESGGRRRRDGWVDNSQWASGRLPLALSA